MFKARIIVGADGEVVEVQVLKGVDPAFDAAHQGGADALALQAGDGVREAGRGGRLTSSRPASSSAD